MWTRRRLSVLALALPAWIVMILAGGEWCLMPGSARARVDADHGSASATTAALGARNARSARNSHGAHGAHGAHAVQLAESGPGEHAGHTPIPAQHDSHHSGESRTCSSAAACSVAVATARWTQLEARVHAARPLLVRADRLTSIALAPELPPPRA